ncbi:RNA-binding protein NOB1 [Armadillidium vulgare]|nr:RNA-binding protein NOB1 [Armadillidium vulgare]
MGPVKKIKQLVIDSGAFLRNVALCNYGEEFFTVEDLVDELRDKQALDFICDLPYQLHYREPISTSIKFIKDFTEKTGELRSLSLVDIKVLALTYELEVEAKGTSDHLRNEPEEIAEERNAEQDGNAKQDGNGKKEIVYINDIKILDYFLSANFFLSGENIGSNDFNIFSRLISRYRHLKAAKTVFCHLKAKYEMDFFERICLHYDTVYSNTLIRPKLCSHPEGCSDSSKCQSSPEDCSHPKMCYTYDECINKLQCDHRMIDDKWIEGIREKKFNNYCDYGNDASIDWEQLKVAKRFYYFCEKKICFKIWFFKVLREFKLKGFHTANKSFQENERIVKKFLKELRQFDDNTKEKESKSRIFAYLLNFLTHEDSEDRFNIPTTSNVASVTDAFSSLNISTASNTSLVTEVAEAVSSIKSSLESNNTDTEIRECDEGNDGGADDDNEGWITPSNIKAKKGKNSSVCENDYEDVEVACITSDVALQSILLHIGLSVIGVDGKLIKSLRMYMLRCYICHALSSDMEKMYCYKCGYKTLKKVPCALNPDGTKHIWESHRPINKRATKGGKHVRNPDLVPQLLPKPDPVLEGTNGEVTNMLAENCGFSHEASKYRGTFYWKKNPNDPMENVE